MITPDDIEKAFDRIARTHDGQLLYLFLQRELTAFISSDDPSEGALRTLNARRRFAHELMARMAKGIEESGGTGESSSERLIVFARRPASVVPRHESAREWFERTDPELAGGIPAAKRD